MAGVRPRREAGVIGQESDKDSSWRWGLANPRVVLQGAELQPLGSPEQSIWLTLQWALSLLCGEQTMGRGVGRREVR